MYAKFWNDQSLIKSLYSECMEPVCKKHDLTRMELDILMFLANNPEFTTATEIVENRQLTKSHVSLAVNTLTRKGFLTRSFSEKNRKTIHLTVCENAREIIEDGRNSQQEFGGILFRDFSKEDKEALSHLLSKLEQNIRHHYREESLC